MINDRVLKEPDVHEIFVLDQKITEQKAELEIKKNTLDALKDNLELQALKKNFRGRKAALIREVGFTEDDKAQLKQLADEIIELGKEVNNLKAERNYKQNLFDLFKTVSYSRYWRS